MATRHAPLVPLGEEPADVALQRTPWRKRARLSSVGDAVEAFLDKSGFDRGPWLVVAFALGIAFWFILPDPAQWVAVTGGGLLLATGAVAMWRGNPARTHLLMALVAVGLMVSGGAGVIWLRSAMVGAQPIEYPLSARLTGRVLQRIEQPAEGRIRIIIATREPDSGRAIKVRINVPLEQDRQGMTEGAVVRLHARLMPPSSPMLPGGLDFARRAWFDGLAATGSAQGEVQLVTLAQKGAAIAGLQRRLSAHVRAQLDGSPGAIAAAFASGDRGGIAPADEGAMRDSGLTHLLSISGVHVSALIAAAYFLSIRLLAAVPWLALRLPLPLVAAGIGALAGLGYTLLTGAEVPTVRSCIGAILVLLALALGREPLSLRMVAVAGFVVLLVWPESLSGPSFQMSFTAVLAIVALHQSGPLRSFLSPRDEGLLMRGARHVAVLLLTGIIIELALTPIVLFHFHRTGLYGAVANVVAIPLVSVATMPLLALALLLDTVGLGAPLWWLVGKSLELLLWVAHQTADMPGAVSLMPQMGGGTYALFLAGGIWLALWRGWVRWLALLPVGVATVALLMTPVPDVLITGDGRQVGIVSDEGHLLVLRDSRSSFTRDTMMELAGVAAEPVPLEQWPGSQCGRDFCAITVHRGGRDWHLLLGRSNEQVEERALAAACERADIVVSDRWLPQSCHPRFLLADRRELAKTGGMAITLDRSTDDGGPHVTTVAQSQGEHGWWRGTHEGDR